MVILDVSPLFWVDSFVDAWMSHVEAHPFPEGTGDCVSRVNPTVGVEDVLGNVFGVYAVNGVANILEKEGVNYV